MTYIVELSGERKVRFISPQVERYFGIDADSFMNVPGVWNRCVHPDDRERVLAALGVAIQSASECVQEYRFITPSMGERWVVDAATIVRDEYGRATHLEGYIKDVTDHVRQEESTRANEATLRSIFDNAAIGIVQVGPDQKVIRANQAFCRMLGYACTEVIGMAQSRITHPEDWQEQRGLALDLLSGRIDQYQLSKRFIRKDGTNTWARVTYSVVRDPVGDVEFCIGMVEDLTRARNLEEELAGRERYYRSLIENSSDIILVLGATGEFVYVSPAASDVLGIDPAAMIGRNMHETVHPDDADALRHGLGRAVALQGRVEDMQVRMRQRTGGWKILDIRCVSRLNDAAVAGIILNARDATTRIAAAQRIAFQARLLAAVDEAVIATDLDGNIQYWNGFAESLYGWTQAEVIGRNLIDLTPAPEANARVAQMLRQLSQGRTFTGEFWLHRRDGSPFLARVTESPVVDADGLVTGIVGISSDITNSRRVEDQLRQAQKMEAVGQLAGGIAHDFNNILTAIIGSADLLLDDRGAIEPDEDLLQIKQSAMRAAELTRKLLAFSRKQVLKPAVIQLETVLEDMRSMLRRVIGENVDLHFEAESPLPPVFADRGEIEQVILNFVVNARDAMPNGGPVSVRVGQRRARDERDVEGARIPAELYVVLSVEDSGCGIPQGLIRRIFDPFFTTKAPGKGTGLGLATVYGIVKQSKGYLRLQSTVGQGTRFEVLLPPAQCTDVLCSTPATLPNRPVAPDTDSPVVLLVDDDDSVRLMTARMLQRLNYAVLQAPDANSAMAVLEQLGTAPSLLLTDMMLPVTTGLELARTLRGRYPELPVLFVSGLANGDFGDSDGLPDSAWLEKPFTTDHLRAAIDQVSRPSTSGMRERSLVLNSLHPVMT